MPKVKTPMAPGGTQRETKTPQIPLEEELKNRPMRPLVLDERIRLQQIFDDPVFRQAWSNAQAVKPSVVPIGLDTALGLQIGNNRLHQLQGWEMFKVALLRQTQEPRLPPPKITDTYPDSGTIEADAAEHLKK